MTASFFEKIDWARPWLDHVRVLGQAIANAPDWRGELDRQALQMDLRNRSGRSIQFVPQAALPNGVAYETYIHETGCVPTRDNLHDFFNALIWLTFPQIKAQLNALQAGEIEKAASSNSPRGKVRDAATIFDENAVLLISSSQDLIQSLRMHAWTDVFLTRRDVFSRDCNILLFGHALMEKLVAPYKSITGHMWVVVDEAQSNLDSCCAVDRLASMHLSRGLTTQEFSPLPILGIPTWWPDQDAFFYHDPGVFRAKRVPR
jgi:hypothetical protein